MDTHVLLLQKKPLSNDEEIGGQVASRNSHSKQEAQTREAPVTAIHLTPS